MEVRRGVGNGMGIKLAVHDGEKGLFYPQSAHLIALQMIRLLKASL